jgi:hypothetical protein
LAKSSYGYQPLGATSQNFKLKSETLILCHWQGLTQNSFGLNFCHLMIYIFQNGENQGIFCFGVF